PGSRSPSSSASGTSSRSPRWSRSSKPKTVAPAKAGTTSMVGVASERLRDSDARCQTCAEVADRLEQQLGVRGGRAPVHEGRSEADRPIPSRGADLHPPVLQHLLPHPPV